MKAVRVKALLALTLMFLAWAGALAWKPTVFLSDQLPKLDLEVVFPKQIGDWILDSRMPAQLVSPDQQAVLNRIYNQTLSRSYVDSKGDRIMLSVAYGGDQSDATRAHRPEVCYPAQGFQIQSQRRDRVNLPDDQQIPVHTLVAYQGGRIEPIIYWVMVGERVANSGTEQKLAQLTYSTRGVIPDGMLVRVSSIDSQPARAFALQKRFIVALAAALPAEQRWRILGHGQS